MDIDTITQMYLAWGGALSNRIGKNRISEHLGRDRATIRIWQRGIKQFGLSAYVDQCHRSARALCPARQASLATKKLDWSIHEREMDRCGQKIEYFLEKEHDVKLSVPRS